MSRTLLVNLRALALIGLVSFGFDAWIIHRFFMGSPWYICETITTLILWGSYCWSKHRIREMCLRLEKYERSRRQRQHIIRDHLTAINCLVPDNQDVLREVGEIVAVLNEPSVPNAIQEEAKRLKMDVALT